MKIDKKVISILKSKYWKNGWVSGQERKVSIEDSEYLKAQ